MVEARLVCEIERDRFITKLPEPIMMIEEGEFRVARSTISENKIRFLVGWSTAESAGVVFEPWQEKVMK